MTLRSFIKERGVPLISGLWEICINLFPKTRHATGDKSRNQALCFRTGFRGAASMMSIKAATIVDARMIAHVDVETWQSTYAGLLPDRMLISLSEPQRASMWSRFIASRPGDVMAAFDEAGTVQGFGSCGLQRDADFPYAGEVFTLYVAPDHQGGGLGRQLLLALYARLVRCGLYSCVIWVLADNPARFFYERLGGRPIAHRRIQMGSAGVEAVAYAWPDLAQTVKNRGRVKNRTA
jgi:ribosomal protein S18 acetylase RimI-like enzyme